MAALAAALAIAAVLATVLSGPSSGQSEAPEVDPAAASAAVSAPAPARRGSAKPFPLSAANGISRWAPVERHVAARARPSRTARVVARLDTLTPERTTNAVLLLARVEREGRLWLKVRLPVLPNNTIGWVPREALGAYRAVTTHLVVDRGRFTATLLRRGKQVFRAPIGVGKSQWPTPAGRFYVRNKLTGYSSPFYGPIAFGTSARSAVLTDWPAGGFIGIHGTNRPDIIPGRVSHGCIRLRNPDILRLAQLMPPGTPVTIR